MSTDRYEGGLVKLAEIDGEVGQNVIVPPAELAPLKVGCTRAKLVEIILQTAVHAEFPAALNGINARREAPASAGGVAVPFRSVRGSEGPYVA